MHNTKSQRAIAVAAYANKIRERNRNTISYMVDRNLRADAPPESYKGNAAKRRRAMIYASKEYTLRELVQAGFMQID
jgi:hypothetical protein